MVEKTTCTTAILQAGEERWSQAHTKLFVCGKPLSKQCSGCHDKASKTSPAYFFLLFQVVSQLASCIFNIAARFSIVAQGKLTWLPLQTNEHNRSGRPVCMQIYNSSYILETQQSKQQMNTFGIAGTSNQSGSNGRTVDSPLHRAQPQRRQRQKQGEGASVKVPLFPVVLYGLLEDAEKHGNASIVSWRPSGVAFKVYRREEFVNKILPKYFKQTKFKSFVRQLNLWGFTCIERGQDKGSCEFSACV